MSIDHIIYPAFHGSCTDALFCYACLVNVTYTATLASTRRKRRPTVASEPQGCRPIQIHTGHAAGMSGALGLVTCMV